MLLKVALNTVTLIHVFESVSIHKYYELTYSTIHKLKTHFLVILEPDSN